MASNGGQNFNIGNHCKKANIKVKHHNATITTNGNQVNVPVEMNIGNDSSELEADVTVNLPAGDHQQQQQEQEQEQQVTGVSRQCSEETEGRQAVSETSDNDGDKYISCQRKPTSSNHETSPKTAV